MQKNARGYTVPDSFTHGTSAQRMKWFTRGYQSGDPGQCKHLHLVIRGEFKQKRRQGYSSPPPFLLSRRSPSTETQTTVRTGTHGG
nr:neutral zinc metallopeptidase [Desulforhopalus vacuolatus]